MPVLEVGLSPIAVREPESVAPGNIAKSTEPRAQPRAGSCSEQESIVADFEKLARCMLGRKLMPGRMIMS